MDASSLVSPGNVEDVTVNILFMRLSDIRKEYAPDAYSYADSLAEIWCDYSRDNHHHRVKLEALMKAAISMINILKPSAKQKLFKAYLEKQKAAVYN